ncbi:ATP-binding protein [Massilia genomosp. 1]|uniref:histidine kinase n=1 Tax=Massilia genomosp. 1 TaxID=2609280 RepID=A0ABX0N391_9BURK|nr:ATP-binding protein [Massilia genomosp. 1]NHZ65989.1 HAMP domain-containing protein [Massilia genomosp. 1]
MNKRPRGWERCLPQSLLGRLTLLMVAGVMLTQLAGNYIWASQRRAESQVEVANAAQQLGHSAASAVRFFVSLPPNYRPLIIQQFGEMGGTRFFVNLNRAPVAAESIGPQPLADIALANVQSTLHADLPNHRNVRVAFVWPEQLVVGDDGTRLSALPENRVRQIMLAKPAPVLLMQVEMEAGHWLYLATLMPSPYFLDSGKLFTRDHLLLHALSLLAVVMLSIPVVRWTTRPLAALSEAATAFGNGERMPALPETGSREFVNTARAFGAMRERIGRYIDDRERLFVSISHDLRTPIMRLKLRAELLDDDTLRAEFHEDIDELEMMVKGALQCVKDSDIHETPTEIRLDTFLARMVRGAQLAGHEVSFDPVGLSVTAKPLALKRAIGNLLENALHYGERAQIAVRAVGSSIRIAVRDHGPGVPEDALAQLFEPYVRLEHGRRQNSSGMGLGLGIARGIAQAHGGQLLLQNAEGGGFCATLVLPNGSTSVDPD